MRVTPRQIETVKMLAHRHFGDDAEVWLFGSRVDDSKKGGDYDFLIETSFDQSDAIIEHKIALIAELQPSTPFEDEKIDCVLKRRSSSFEIPIYAIAKAVRCSAMKPGQLMRIYLDECRLHVEVLTEALADARQWLPFTPDSVEHILKGQVRVLDQVAYIQRAFPNTSAAHWFRLLPCVSAISAAWAWTSGGTRNISLPE